VPFIKRVRIRNYKSLANCDVELGALTVLVGRNGAGKSSFLDALSFVADTLRTSLDHAVRVRGGWREIRSRFCEQDDAKFPMAIGLEMTHRSRSGERRVVFELGFAPSAEHGGIRFIKERIEFFREGDQPEYGYVVEDGKVVWSTFQSEDLPPVLPDRPFLAYWLGGSVARDVYDSLCRIGVYDFNPEAMRTPRAADAGEILRRDGSNIASVVGRIAAGPPGVMDRLVGYLSTIVPGVTSVERAELGPVETLRFRQTGGPSSDPLEFYATSMSDGTLRALGALVALAQPGEGTAPVRLVGIEEPEAALHPAAAGALMGALQEAAVLRQVIVTTHSPDLLNEIDPETDRLLVAESRDGGTVIAPMNRASRESIKEHLGSPGELLRMDFLQPDYDDLQRQMSVCEPAGRSE
jgi:predicted ATPase